MNIYFKLNADNPKENRVIEFLQDKGANKSFIVDAMDKYITTYEKAFSEDPGIPFTATPQNGRDLLKGIK